MSGLLHSREFLDERSRRLNDLLARVFQLTGVNSQLVTLLVIDDQHAQIEAVKRNLQKLPIRVLASSNGVAGLRLLEEGPVRMVFIDMHMPGMDGFAVVNAIRARPGGGTIPVIMISAHASRDEILASNQAGCDDFLVKPFTREAIIEKIRLNLGKYGLPVPDALLPR